MLEKIYHWGAWGPPLPTRLKVIKVIWQQIDSREN